MDSGRFDSSPLVAPHLADMKELRLAVDRSKDLVFDSLLQVAWTLQRNERVKKANEEFLKGQGQEA